MYLMSKRLTQRDSRDTYPMQPTVDENFVPLARGQRAFLVPSLLDQAAKKMEGIQAVLNGKHERFQFQLPPNSGSEAEVSVSSLACRGCCEISCCHRPQISALYSII